MRWLNKGYESSSFVSRFNELQSVYIYGAATVGLSLYETLTDYLNIQVLGFIDRKGSKFTEDGSLNGIPVFSPKILSEIQGNSIVLIGAGMIKDISQTLLSYGFQRNVDFFVGNEFITMYMLEKKEKVYLFSLCIMITEFCTFSCEKCGNLLPHYKNPSHRPISQIMRDLDNFFDYTDYLSLLAITGGDAMAHPQSARILELIGEKYLGTRIGRISFASNAIILPDEHLLNLLKRYNVIYRITDYKTAKQKISETINLLRQNDITYDIITLEHWLDIGFPQESNNIKNDDALIRFADNCHRALCEYLCNNRYYKCGMVHFAERAGWCIPEPNDSYDLSIKPNQNHKREFAEFSIGFSEKGYYTVCQKCNGWYGVNQLKISVGT